MEITLSYYPLLHSAPVNTHSLAVLEKSGHPTQKFAYVGADGLMHVFRFDKRELSLRFSSKAPTFESECIIADGNNLLLSSRGSLLTFNRKGDQIGSEPMPVDGHVTSMYLFEKTIFVAAGCLCSTVHSSKNPIRFESPIVGFASIEAVPFVGLQNGSVFSIIGVTSQLVRTLQSSITLFSSFNRTLGETLLLCATSDGILHFFNKTDVEISQITLPSPGTSCTSFDIDKDGFAELMVSSEDGTVSLVSMAILEHPKLLSSIRIGFSATNIEAGFIFSPDLCSAVVTSLTGQIGLVSAETRADRSLLNSKAPKVTEAEITQLKESITRLEQSVKASSSRAIPVSANTKVEIRVDQALQRFTFIAESDRPVSRVSLHSTINLSFFSRPDSRVSISSRPDSAVVTSIDQTSTRLAFDFSYEIGKGGEMQCFITFGYTTSVLVKDFSLKPFGLLKKSTEGKLSKESEENLCVFEASTSGNVSDFKTVIDSCLPDTLEEDNEIVYLSGCSKLPMSVSYSHDKFVARSNAIPIIVQLRAYILDSMNKAKQRAIFNTKIGDRCLDEFFKSIKGRFIEVSLASSQHSRLKALQEVRNSSPNSGIGNEDLLQDATKIEKKYDETKMELAELCENIRQYYLEIWKSHGIDAAGRLGELDSIIKDATSEEAIRELMAFMKANPK